MRKVESDNSDLEVAFNSTGYATATQDTTTDHDVTLTENLYLDGGSFITWGANPGDYIVAQVVAPDGTTVVKTWVYKWGVSTMDGCPEQLLTDYKGMIPNTYKLRVKYTSTSTTTDARFTANFRLHRII